MQNHSNFIKERISRIFITIIWLASFSFLHWNQSPSVAQEGERLAPRNIILFIGDGMGFEHVRLGRLAAGGQPFSFEAFPYRGQVTTYSANSSVTDSAAAATAIATGHKVNNGVVSLAIPGDGAELQTLLEYFKARGKSVGLVTTVTTTHATPACFGAHETSRNNMAQIAQDYLERSTPMLVLGGGGDGMSSVAAQAAGYTVVSNRNAMLALDINATPRLMGLFGSGYLPYEANGLGDLPHLHEMVNTALSILDNDPQGFFLMVEGGLIDQGAHANNAAYVAGEVREFDQAVRAALDWLPAGSETLIVITADHETGGLSIVNETLVGGLPTVSWSTGGHSAADVPVFATGYGAESFTGTLDNTDFFSLITQAGLGYNQAPTPNAGADVYLELAPGGSVDVELELRGSVADDDISSGPLVTQWSQTSGPTAAQIGSPDALTSTVQFSAFGDYAFRLRAGDGLAQADDSVQISIQPAATPVPTGTPVQTGTPVKTPSPTPTIAPEATLSPTIPVPAPEATLTATPTSAIVLKLRRKLSAGRQKISAQATKIAADGSRSSYKPVRCQVGFYLLSSQHPEPGRANRLTSLPAGAQTIFELPFFQRALRRNAKDALAVELEGALSCNGSAVAVSERVHLLYVKKRDWPVLLRTWRSGVRRLSRW